MLIAQTTINPAFLFNRKAYNIFTPEISIIISALTKIVKNNNGQNETLSGLILTIPALRKVL